MIDDVLDVRTRLRNGQYRSRAAVAHGAVARVLALLGWPTFDPEVVVPEYEVGGSLVDFALCVDPSVPSVLIDVHAPSRPVTADAALLHAARATDATLLLQTDGAEWRFDLLEAEAAADPLVDRVNLFAADLDGTVDRLARLLGHDRVRSGEAAAAAREACRERNRLRRLEERLPEIWNALVAENDAGIVALVVERVRQRYAVEVAAETVERVLLPKLRILTVGDDPPPVRSGGRQRRRAIGQLGLDLQADAMDAAAEP